MSLNDLREALPVKMQTLERVLTEYGVALTDETPAKRRPGRNTVLREMLAIHAPHEIPDWFEPVLPSLPKLPPLPEINAPHTHVQGPTAEGLEITASPIIQCSMNRYLKKLEDGDVPEALDIDYPTLQKQFGMKAEEVDAIYSPFYASVKEYRNALRYQQANREQVRMAQWPWAWADLVIKHRN